MIKNILIVSLLLGLGFVLLGFVIKRTTEPTHVVPDTSPLKAETKAVVRVGGRSHRFLLVTLEHDGHLWVARHHPSPLIHHPDCPCKK